MAGHTLSTKDYFLGLDERLSAAKKQKALYSAIVNAPFYDPMTALDYDLGIVVLLLADPANNNIDRVALSDTYSAKGAVGMSPKPFSEIKIPLNHKENLIARAIASNKPQQTADWKYLFTPALTAKEAHFNQAGAGIEASVIYPLDKKIGGALIYSLYQPLMNLDTRHMVFMAKYAKLVSEHLAKLAS